MTVMNWTLAFERQGGHADDHARHVLDIRAQLGLYPADGLTATAYSVLTALA
jgi:hypothetical protein